MTHTPSPWEVGFAYSFKDGKATSEYFVRVPGDDIVIASGIINPARLPHVDDTAKANAHLIASAPEMLDALIGIAEACRSVADGMCADYLYGYLIGIERVARNAVEKTQP